MNFQHRHHIIPTITDHLDRALPVLAGLEVERTGALERGELFGVDAALERLADALPQVGRLAGEVGLAHQEGRAVVVGVEKPGGDLVSAGGLEVAGVGIVDIDAAHGGRRLLITWLSIFTTLSSINVIVMPLKKYL